MGWLGLSQRVRQACPEGWRAITSNVLRAQLLHELEDPRNGRIPICGLKALSGQQNSRLESPRRTEWKYMFMLLCIAVSCKPSLFRFSTAVSLSTKRIHPSSSFPSHKPGSSSSAVHRLSFDLKSCRQISTWPNSVKASGGAPILLSNLNNSTDTEINPKAKTNSIRPDTWPWPNIHTISRNTNWQIAYQGYPFLRSISAIIVNVCIRLHKSQFDRLASKNCLCKWYWTQYQYLQIGSGKPRNPWTEWSTCKRCTCFLLGLKEHPSGNKMTHFNYPKIEILTCANDSLPISPHCDGSLTPYMSLIVRQYSYIRI